MVSWLMRGCAILLAFAMFYGAHNSYQQNRAFAARGKTAVVEPMGGYTETTTTKKKFFITTSETTSHSAELQFVTDRGQRVAINRNLPDDVFQHLLDGDEVRVEYLPDDPGGARFVGHDGNPLLSLAFGLVISGLTWVFWRKF